MNRSEIMEYAGADNWEMVVSAFSGESQEQVVAELDAMFTWDDNSELAAAIYDELC